MKNAADELQVTHALYELKRTYHLRELKAMALLYRNIYYLL